MTDAASQTFRIDFEDGAPEGHFFEDRALLDVQQGARSGNGAPCGAPANFRTL